MFVSDHHSQCNKPLIWPSTEKGDFSWQIEDGRNIQMVYHLLLENRKFLCHSIWHQRRNDLTRTPSAYWVCFSTNEKTILWTLWTLVSFSACVDLIIHIAVSPLKIKILCTLHVHTIIPIRCEGTCFSTIQMDVTFCTLN